jgi:hypothetical protein
MLLLPPEPISRLGMPGGSRGAARRSPLGHSTSRSARTRKQGHAPGAEVFHRLPVWPASKTLVGDSPDQQRRGDSSGNRSSTISHWLLYPGGHRGWPRWPRGSLAGAPAGTGQPATACPHGRGLRPTTDLPRAHDFDQGLAQASSGRRHTAQVPRRQSHERPYSAGSSRRRCSRRPVCAATWSANSDGNTLVHSSTPRVTRSGNCSTIAAQHAGRPGHPLLLPIRRCGHYHAKLANRMALRLAATRGGSSPPPAGGAPHWSRARAAVPGGAARSRRPRRTPDRPRRYGYGCR